MYFVDDILLSNVALFQYEFGELLFIQVAVDVVGDVAALGGNEKGATRYFMVEMQMVQDSIDGFLGFAESEIDVCVDHINSA